MDFNGENWNQEESSARRVVQVTSPGGCLVLSETGQTPHRMDLNGESWNQFEAAVISMGKMLEGVMPIAFT